MNELDRFLTKLSFLGCGMVVIGVLFIGVDTDKNIFLEVIGLLVAMFVMFVVLCVVLAPFALIVWWLLR